MCKYTQDTLHKQDIKQIFNLKRFHPDKCNLLNFKCQGAEGITRLIL